MFFKLLYDFAYFYFDHRLFHAIILVKLQIL